MLWPNTAEAEDKIGFVAAFHKGMGELGYVDGRTIIVEERFSDGTPRRLDELAAELVRLNVDLIVTGSTQGTSAVARATTQIPIVTATTADPVGQGLAASLAHPGGNVTGNASFIPQMTAKRLELLRQIVSPLPRAGVLAPRNDPLYRSTFEVMTETARALGVELELFAASDATTYDRAFATASATGVRGFVIFDSAIFHQDASVIGALALKYKLPTGGAPIHARNGGLFGHAVLFRALFHNASSFVDKILKGAKPGDIPFEQATKFETVVNLKTAAALGLEIPPTVLASADEVIE